MTNCVKIGVVGLRRGRNLISDLLLVEEAVISHICDRDGERLESCRLWLKERTGREDFKSLASFDELLAGDCDGVIIATDALTHVDLSVKALMAGKHVLSEVPAINSTEEALALLRAEKLSGKKYMLGENCCFWAFVNTWKSIYEKGLIGQCWYAEGEYLHNVEELMVDKNNEPTWRASYDAIKYLTHDLGPLLYMLDDECVMANGFRPDINPIGSRSTGTPNELAIFKTKKGALIKIFVSFGLQREPPVHNFVIYGSEGTLETARHSEDATYAHFKSIPHTRDLIRIPAGISYPGSGVGGHGGADFHMVKAFIDAIVKDGKVPVDSDLAIRMSLPGIYAHESALKGSVPIDIPGIDDLKKRI